VASLRELQARFAAALHGQPAGLMDEIPEDGIDPAGRLRIYANNSRATFEAALERTYPVLRRRVGDEYFRQLAHHYRERAPSQSGDLLWVGRNFPAFVAESEADTGYAWLADLAALEWACEISLNAAWASPLAVQSLGGIPEESIAGTKLTLQPSLLCVSSPYPVLDVWQANQPGISGESVDLRRGGQQVLVSCGPDGLELRAVARDAFEFVRALQEGASLGVAVDTSGLPIGELARVLGMLFQAGLVTGADVAVPEDEA
jgi:hypothetical protein